ncbi:MAG: hypothetical protein PHR19_08405 [Bacteroidales bacterium]|nr:hypothetical protein [Bacteroidales bacterium]
MSNLSINELIIDGYPEDEHIILWPNNIYKYSSSPQDYYIEFVLQNRATGQLSTIQRNLIESPATFIGGVIRNQSLSTSKIGRYFSFPLHIDEEQKSVRLPSRFFEQYNWYFPKKSSSIIIPSGDAYTIGYHNSIQEGIELKKGNKTIFFPAYVIAQYFYLRAKPITDVILSSTPKDKDLVKTFYKKIEEPSPGDIKIYCMSAELDKHIEEIARFALDPYANKYFNQFHNDLFQSHLKHRQINQGHLNSSMATLRSYFPCHGDINITFRGIKLSANYYLVFEIVEEDSTYPFDSLNGILMNNRQKKASVPIGNKPRKRSVRKNNKRLNRKKPNAKFQSKSISNGITKDGRKGLKGKTVQHTKITKERTQEVANSLEKREIGVNFSSDHKESSGDENTVQINPEFSDLKRDEPSPSIYEFKQILSIASQKFETFSAYTHEYDFPLFYHDNGYICLRSLLVDNESPRKYLLAEINFEDESYIAIDIQRDERIPRISTLLIKENEFLVDIEKTIYEVLRNYAREGKGWLHGEYDDTFTFTTLNHAHKCGKASLNRWAISLKEKLESSESWSISR